MTIRSMGSWVATAALLTCSSIHGQAVPQPAPTAAGNPADLLRSFRSVFVQSGTIYMKREMMQRALEQRPEFTAWQLQSAPSAESADVVIEITLPFLSFEWNYKMVHRGGLLLASGKVKAFVDQTAAPQLAVEIVGHIQKARPLPASAESSALTQPTAANAPLLEAKEWKAKWISSPHNRVPKGTAITLAVSSENVAIRDKQGTPFSIPVSHIGAVTYHTNVKDPKQKWDQFWDSAANSGGESGAILVIFPIALLGDLILDPMKTTEHYIAIHWLADGLIQSVELQLSEADCIAVLKELEKVRGRPSKNLPEEVKNIRKTLAEEYYKSPLLKIERAVNLAWVELPPREYRIIVIPSERDLADVYFLRGDLEPASTWNGEVQPGWVAGQAVVEIERKPQSTEKTFEARATYVERNGILTLSEIETSELILRFNKIPVATAK